MTIVRLYRSRYSPKDATGATLHGGRWNSPGHAVLYASSTLALACLEVLVHIRNVDLVPTDYVFCEVEVPDAPIGPWDLTGEAALAKIESPVLSREFGDAWIRSTTVTPSGVVRELHQIDPGLSPEELEMATQGIEVPTPVQAVPSVIVPREMNYLISPDDSEFDKLIWRKPEPFRFDPRLIGTAAE